MTQITNSKTMELTNETIRDLIKRRPHQKEIEKGIKHQKRLKFHTQTALNKWDFDSAYIDFSYWISTEQPELLPKDKAARILQLIRPPICTVELTESIFSKLNKIFHSNDAFFDYRFSNPDLKTDWEMYRNKSFWAVHGFQAMQSAIDSVWCVDFPDFQKGSRPEPENRLVNIENVIDIQNDRDNNCEYFIYQYGEKLVVYDTSMIRVFAYKQGEIGQELITISHGLDYTPARMFWSESLEDGNYLNKEAPITKELSDLDWLLLHRTAKKYLDLANAYPREIGYRHDSDSKDDNLTEDKGRPKEQRKPIGAHLMGPGTYIEVDPPMDSSEADLMKNPFLLISPDTDTLTWHVSEEQRLKNDIYRSVVGTDVDIKNEQAKNEKQVDSAFESQLSVLTRIKKNFEIIHSFADSTICKIRYESAFLGCAIDYGSSFFLKTITELHQDYELAKKTGNEVILSEITSNILDSKYRDDKSSRRRAEIIRDLDPLPEKTITEAIEIYKNGGVDKINFVIKSNLLSFVRRFERENIPLVEFGENIDYNVKIETIINRFKEYASEQRQELSDQGI